MLHARKDYNRRIQDNENVIGENEPVFLLRAQDKLMLPMLHQYLRLLRANREYDRPAETGVLRHIERTAKWQHEGQSKTPDTPLTEIME